MPRILYLFDTGKTQWKRNRFPLRYIRLRCPLAVHLRSKFLLRKKETSEMFTVISVYNGFIVGFLFVCLFGVIVPLENFSLIWRRHHYRWRAANFDLCSALVTIEQWGFLSVTHLLWHGASVYNGHLRGSTHDTHTYCRAFSIGAVTTCFLRLWSVVAGMRIPKLPLAGPTL